MKTKSLKTLVTLLVFAGISLFNTARACTANFTYTIGTNGHVSFTSTSSGYTFGIYCTWNPGDGSGFMYGNNPTHIYTANGTYNVLLIAQDTLCTDTITIPVTITNVTTPCTLSASYTWVNGLDGQVKFTSTSTGTNAGTLYYWNFGDGSPLIQAGDTITHKYIYSTYYFPLLTIRDTGTAYCADSISNYVTVLNADSNYCSMLHTNFTYSVGPNGHVTFTSTSIGVGYNPQYYWDANDGSGRVSTGTTNSYYHIYTTNGTFNVKMAVFINDSLTCQDSTIIPVTISNVDTAAPCNLKANFSVTYDSNGQVKFTSTSTGTHSFTQYYWRAGDGSSTMPGFDTLTYKYPFIDTYNVTLIVSDTGAGYCMDSITIPVNIYNKDSLKASFVYMADSLISGKYNFWSTSQGTNVNTYYKWTPGDGTPADSGLGMTTYTHTYSMNGPYSATLTIWYTILPKVNSRVSISNRFSESSYTAVVHVTTVTGIASVTGEQGQFILYPNPTTGQYRVAITGLSQNQKAEIDVLNVLGEVVYKTPVEVTSNKLSKDIDMQSAPAGIYFVKVITATKVYTTKVIIER